MNVSVITRRAAFIADKVFRNCERTEDGLYKVGIKPYRMVNQLQCPQLFTQCPLIWFKRAYTLTVRTILDRSIPDDRRFVLLARWPNLNSPALDVIRSTRVDFHIIPVIMCEIFN